MVLPRDSRLDAASQLALLENELREVRSKHRRTSVVVHMQRAVRGFLAVRSKSHFRFIVMTVVG